MLSINSLHTLQMSTHAYLANHRKHNCFTFIFLFRISLLTISVGCAIGCCILAGYLFHHRRVKVFKVASPIFLLITLIGCSIMYLEVNTSIKWLWKYPWKTLFWSALENNKPVNNKMIKQRFKAILMGQSTS